MPSIDLSNAEVQAAFISGIFTVLSALIAAVAAAMLGQTLADRRKLERELELAVNDIAFLLEVEELHCENNKRSHGKSEKTLFAQKSEMLAYHSLDDSPPGAFALTDSSTD